MGDRPLYQAWSDYWADYYEAHRSRVQRVAQKYPRRRGLQVSYAALLEAGVPHETFRYEPGIVLGVGVETFGELVAEMGIENAWDREFNALVLHVVDLPEAFAVNTSRYLSDHLNELVSVDVTVSSEPEVKADLMEAAFVCPDGHVTRVHQEHVTKQFIDTCGRADCSQSVWHEPNRSLFSRIQRAYVAGEHGDEFEDVMVVLGGLDNIYDDMRVGDEFHLNAIPRAETRGETTHGDISLAGLHIEPTDRLGG